MIELANWLAWGIVEGDWVNDWLTHLPRWFETAVHIYLTGGIR